MSIFRSKKSRLVSILILSISIIYTQSHAQPYFGAEINYSCVGQDSFPVNLITYRDCSAAQFNTEPLIRSWLADTCENSLR
ncbi:MAG TPA: hypothetical protein P5050_05675 [Bacteroidia bacterium]|nr:hypothetical protein [Bacteroidia bacterium]HRS58693.1 hypothetical protein [Bacteroidia bacterium]HRU68316.1 hypothetical protein [Bacteroidia bacterium]